MAEIKSALEIALEKTQGVNVDKAALEADRARKEGKMLVSRYLADPELSFRDALAGSGSRTDGEVREGMIEVLLANLVLPQDAVALKGVKRIGEAFSVLARNEKKIHQLFSQLESFFGEYIEEREALRERINKQYEPIRRQKERELSQRMGQTVRIDPMTDPDFLAQLRKLMGQLEDRYGQVLAKVKAELAGQLR